MGILTVFNRRFICIDNSTNSTAYCIFNGSKLEEYGEITFKGKDTYERLMNIPKALEPLRKKCEKINELYIEQTTFVQSQKTVILLGMAEGAVISSIGHPGMSVRRVSPLVWQKFIGNPPLTAKEKAKVKADNPNRAATWLKGEHRKIRKQRTMDIINKKFGLQETSDNIGDAFGLALYAMSR